MAGIALNNVILLDRFPGAPVSGVPLPGLTDMTKYAYTEEFPLGTKFQLYDPVKKGFSTFVYGRFMKHASEDVDLAIGGVCGIQVAGTYPFDVINNGDNVHVQGPLCVALFALDYGAIFTTLAKSYVYGWFWCGGVAPSGIFTGTFATNAAATLAVSGSIAAGAGMKVVDSAGVQMLWITSAAADVTILPAAFLLVAAA